MLAFSCVIQSSKLMHGLSIFWDLMTFLLYHPVFSLLKGVQAFTQKKKIHDAMVSAGCTASKTASQLTQISLTQLKAEFSHFIQHPSTLPNADALWLKLGPIMLASMLLKPLEGDKIKSLRNGLENESKVLKRLAVDLNETFLISTPFRAVNTYRIGLELI